MICQVSQWYIQLYNQSDPNKLWHSKEWSNVTKKYSGLFFRVVDNNNSVLSVMNQSGPVMDIIKTKIMGINNNDIFNTSSVTISVGQWSEYIKLGKSGNDCQG